MRIAIIASALLLVGAGPVFAHSGGLDQNGCHNNKAKNVYECHEGALKDQSFKSKAEAETKLGRAGGTAKPADKSKAADKPVTR